MFAQRLKELRTNNSYTQTMLAKTLGVTQGAVGNWECGIREPNFTMLSKIADCFNVTLGYMLGTE